MDFADLSATNCIAIMALPRWSRRDPRLEQAKWKPERRERKSDERHDRDHRPRFGLGRQGIGAVCALVMDADGTVGFKPSEVVSFDQALAFIEAESSLCNTCLIAVDQPTIVPNETGCRPVDRVAASVISFIGGGVQPANRSRRGIFDDDAPFWRFKARLGAKETLSQAASPKALWRCTWPWPS